MSADKENEEKLYRIGEVGQILNLKTHVLRFWETEFPQIAPMRAASGQRLYTENHIGILKRIQQLLHDQGMTIDGARRILAGKITEEELFAETDSAFINDPVFMEMLETELLEIRKMLTGIDQA